MYDTCTPRTSEQLITNMVVALFQTMSDIVDNGKDEITQMFNSRAWKITGDFILLLSRHYTTEHSVSFYANALNITSDYLSVVVKECTGISPKETIDGYLVHAMKALLESTNLPIKNIAERLHYEDNSHLCKVFRRRNIV